MKTIKRGDRGSEVRLLQEKLTEHGYPTTPDGIFGSGTESKVMQFQRSAALAADGIVGPKTWENLLATPVPQLPQPPSPLPPVLAHLRALGHDVMWEGDFHLNLFGVRNPQREANSFDDMLGVAYTEEGLWKVEIWPGTTDPGTFHLKNPSRVTGTAILRPGQYKDVWKIDLHAGKYEALCQRNGMVWVYRDGDRNTVLNMDPSTLVQGAFGINIHRSSMAGESDEVGKWSAGCQVHARLDGFNRMMELARRQVDFLGKDTFTYTLMDQWW